MEDIVINELLRSDDPENHAVAWEYLKYRAEEYGLPPTEENLSRLAQAVLDQFKHSETETQTESNGTEEQKSELASEGQKKTATALPDDDDDPVADMLAQIPALSQHYDFTNYGVDVQITDDWILFDGEKLPRSEFRLCADGYWRLKDNIVIFRRCSQSGRVAQRNAGLRAACAGRRERVWKADGMHPVVVPHRNAQAAPRKQCRNCSTE